MERFWNKVSKTPTCWWWTAGVDKDGYGRFWFRGQTRRAHRVAVYLSTGEWPMAPEILHSCNNPGCVRPAHLSEGTRTDNAADMIGAERQARGESHGMRELSLEDVQTIKASVKRRGDKARMARRYGLSKTHVGRIVAGLSWKHVC